jgi:NAD(P)-dependent dehydrogenase (short-subunit alcohol dehydrogenase family)
MSSGPVLLLFGAGPRVGAAVAAKFAANGYRVATVSRKGTGKKTAEGYLSLSADLTHPDVIPGIFEQVQKGFNAPPSVIVYNAGFYSSPPQGKNLFALPLAALTSDIAGNIITPFAAVQEAIKGWDTLPKEAPKTFIFTGNGFNDIHIPETYAGSLSVGKSGAAAWIASADLAKPIVGAR